MGEVDVPFEPLSELDHEFYSVITRADELIKEGVTIYFKWTCEECKSRQTFEEPNHIYMLGVCEECSHTTDLRRRGCNYMVVAISNL